MLLAKKIYLSSTFTKHFVCLAMPFYFAQLTNKVEGEWNKDVSFADGGAKKYENKPKRKLDSKSK